MINRYYEFLYDEDCITGLMVADFLRTINSSFIPHELIGEEYVFNDRSYLEIASLPANKRIHIIGADDSQFNIGSWGQMRLIPRRFGLMWRYIHLPKELNIKEIEFIITLPTFKIGFIENQEYHKYQSEDDPQLFKHINTGKYDLTEKDIKNFGMPLYFNENIQLYRIDISNNPGRERFLPGMKFIPAYKIWYGKEAQELFGKQKILEYPSAIYTKELENDVIEMQLMDDITKCNLPYNQEKQRDIVNYFGIEKLEVPKY